MSGRPLNHLSLPPNRVGRSIIAKKEGSQVKDSTDSSNATLEDEDSKGMLFAALDGFLLHLFSRSVFSICFPDLFSG